MRYGSILASLGVVLPSVVARRSSGLHARLTTTDTCAFLANQLLAVEVTPGIPDVTIGLLSEDSSNAPSAASD